MLADPAVERLRVAVAYANLTGFRAFQGLLAAADGDIEVEIILTLDMGITRKAALEALLQDFSGSVKVITSESGFGTFHAKAFVVDRSGADQRALIGSANLTYPALTRNHEAISVGDLAQDEVEAWEMWWADLVAAADDLTEDVIATYSERRPPPGRRERIADEELETGKDGSPISLAGFELSADAADWLLIDWGGTGEYRVQYEFPKAAAAFFQPDVDQEQTQTVTILHGGGEYGDNQLTYYPDNGMARINLDGDIPVVADASIELKTSLFTRLGPDHYELHLVNRAERAALLAEAKCMGGTGHTRRKDETLRQFGWAGSA